LGLDPAAANPYPETMKLFQRRFKYSEHDKDLGNRIAGDHGLPGTVETLHPGAHSVERRFTVFRSRGYKANIDSVDPYRVMEEERKALEKRCAELGIRPLFRGDYVTLHSFPRRNMVTVETLGSSFHGGVKRLEQKTWFDVLAYVKT